MILLKFYLLNFKQHLNQQLQKHFSVFFLLGLLYIYNIPIAMVDCLCNNILYLLIIIPVVSGLNDIINGLAGNYLVHNLAVVLSLILISFLITNPLLFWIITPLINIIFLMDAVYSNLKNYLN